MPRTLHLLRHAKSSWDEPSLSDHDRPLAPRGRSASKKMAGHLRDQGIAPDVVLCSSAVRTQETLKLIRGGFAEEALIAVEPDLYGAAAEELLGRLRALDEDLYSVMVIGHNPGMQQLALGLASDGEDLDQVRRKFPTAALATLTFDCDWGELDPGSAQLIAFVRPRDL